MTRRVYRSEMSQPMRALLIRAKRRPIIATRFGWRFRGDTDRVNDRTLAVLVGMKLLTLRQAKVGTRAVITLAGEHVLKIQR